MTFSRRLNCLLCFLTLPLSGKNLENAWQIKNLWKIVLIFLTVATFSYLNWYNYSWRNFAVDALLWRQHCGIVKPCFKRGYRSILLDCRHIIKTSLLNRQYCQRWLIQFCHLADFFSCVEKCYEWELASKNNFEILPFTMRLSVSLDCLWWLGDNVVDDYDRLDQTFLRRTVIGL